MGFSCFYGAEKVLKKSWILIPSFEWEPWNGVAQCNVYETCPLPKLFWDSLFLYEFMLCVTVQLSASVGHPESSAPTAALTAAAASVGHPVIGTDHCCHSCRPSRVVSTDCCCCICRPSRIVGTDKYCCRSCQPFAVVGISVGKYKHCTHCAKVEESCQKQS